MRIKRILSLVLCIALTCLLLVGCTEDVIGSYLDIYDYEPEKVVKMEFDLYLIVGEATTAPAKTTVQDKINQYLNDKFDTTVNIKYLTADEYAEEVSAAVESSTASEIILKSEDKNNDGVEDALKVNAGKIVLVTGEDMMAEFVESGKLYNLSSFLTTNDFGKLNTSIPEVLVDAARDEFGALYCIPNNHVIGNYEYVCIKRDVALKHNYSDRTELRQIISDDDVAALRAVIGSENVEIVSGPYEMRDEKEAAGWICNIREYPEATAAEAFSSAFAIIPEATVFFDYNGDGKIDGGDFKDSDKDGKISDEEKKRPCLADINEVARRAMEVVYSINADSVLRNYLQYGIEGINYSIDAETGLVVYSNGEDTRYHMPLEYTGDIFMAKFIMNDYRGKSWTLDMYNNGKLQNGDAK